MSGNIVLELFVMFAAAKVAGELFERVHLPPVVGEVLAGVAIGPFALGWIHLGEAQEAFSEIGVIVLLFTVGLKTDLSEFRSVAGPATQVGLLGIALPFAGGWALMRVLGYGQIESLFVGTALVATSVGITARVLQDLGQLSRPESRVILGAAVLDDVVGLAILAVVAGVAAGDASTGRVLLVVAEAVGFVAILALLGPWLARRHSAWLGSPRIRQRPFVLAVALCLGLSALAELIGLAALVGAFLAGMILAEAGEAYRFDELMEPVEEFLVPFFFVFVGAQLDPRAFADPDIALLTLAVSAVAVVGKVVGSAAGARSLGRRGALLVGVGMTPRGEVGILVASLGLSLRVVQGPIYAAVIGMSLLTTVLAPPLLEALFRREARSV